MIIRDMYHIKDKTGGYYLHTVPNGVKWKEGKNGAALFTSAEVEKIIDYIRNHPNPDVLEQLDPVAVIAIKQI